jgi:hypothetical protein
MNHRRLRLPAAIALVALAAPVLAADPSSNLQRDARQVRDDIQHSSAQLGQQVAQGVHQARHQFTVQWYRTGVSIRHWWDHTRETVARI